MKHWNELKRVFLVFLFPYKILLFDFKIIFQVIMVIIAIVKIKFSWYLFALNLFSHKEKLKRGERWKNRYNMNLIWIDVNWNHARLIVQILCRLIVLFTINIQTWQMRNEFRDRFVELWRLIYMKWFSLFNFPCETKSI